MMFASLLLLSRTDIKSLKIYDEYSIHRIVYDLFEDVRSLEEKNSSLPSGILYADKGGDFYYRKILILSNRIPKKNVFSNLSYRKVPDEFLMFEKYTFEVVLNPTKRDSASKKLVPIKDKELLKEWFLNKSEKTWGFSINPSDLQIDKTIVSQFQKKSQQVTQSKTVFKGTLKVMNRELFIQSFKNGIGRGKAFGCGLLQLVPQKTYS